jgi:CxxC motif-containing protein (DUF1111 family)
MLYKLILSAAGFALALSGCQKDIGVSTVDIPLAGTPGAPLAGLTAEQLEEFADGLEDFAEEEEVEDGLGPVFNGASCGNCHISPAVGGVSEIIEFRFGRQDGNNFSELRELGGELVQFQAIGAVEGFPGCENGFTFVPEQIPAEANVSTGRITTPLFGLGLVDAVPDSTFFGLSILQQIFTPATAGKVSIVPNIAQGGFSVGKFGWKAQVATIFDFSGDAYINEMGITNPLFPEENCPQGDCSLLACDPVADLEDDGTALVNFTNFMSRLAPLPTKPQNLTTQLGGTFFSVAGCPNCHVSTLTTGSNEIAALNRKTFNPYSDFLLHDMGSLGDGIVQNQAKGKDMRTAPLWGAGSRTLFLHDGRATNIRDAVLAHAGQGAASRNFFASLPRPVQDAVVAFIKTL